MKTYYTEEPTKLEKVSNSVYFFRYDIRKEQREMGEMGVMEEWVAEEVKVYAPLSANAITMAVILDKWSSDEEAKLVNEYNGVQLGIYGEVRSVESQQKVERYREMLKERARLKADVDEYCMQNGIK